MEFVEEVPQGHFGPRKFDWKEVCRQLIERPGEWGKVGEFSPSVATHIRQGRYPAVDPSMYEVKTRRSGNEGRAWVYMRYVG